MIGTRSPRIVWITGASSGIGKALVELFVTEGEIVVASARSRGSLNSLQRSLAGAPGEYFPLVCDVRTERSVRSAAQRITARFKRVDVLLNNAGVTVFKDFAQTSVQEFDHVIGTNLRGAFLATKCVLPGMLRRKSGMIVNIQSFAAKTIYTGSSVYSASKSGGVALMDCLRAEVRSKGIKVLNVYPGATLTPMWSSAQQKTYAKVMMAPAEVARKIYEATRLSESMMIEELVLRPQIGDLKV
jgi:NADP-dependent 3-hydroxy acid dehydrogenase YdfG